MDKKSFVRILRKVIREEVGRAVKQALTEQTVNHKQVIEHGMNLAEIAENPMPNRPYAKKKKFSKNSMLNDLLNETAQDTDFASMMQEPRVSQMDYPQMGPTRTSSMVQPTMPTTGINGERVDTSKPEMEAVQKALTRDYSGLIKAMDKKNGKMGTR